MINDPISSGWLGLFYLLTAQIPYNNKVYTL